MNRREKSKLTSGACTVLAPPSTHWHYTLSVSVSFFSPFLFLITINVWFRTPFGWCDTLQARLCNGDSKNWVTRASRIIQRLSYLSANPTVHIVRETLFFLLLCSLHCAIDSANSGNGKIVVFIASTIDFNYIFSSFLPPVYHFRHSFFHNSNVDEDRECIACFLLFPLDVCECLALCCPRSYAESEN